MEISEETIFGSNKIKKQHEPMKFHIEEVVSSHKHLKPWIIN